MRLDHLAGFDEQRSIVRALATISFQTAAVASIAGKDARFESVVRSLSTMTAGFDFAAAVASFLMRSMRRPRHSRRRRPRT